MKVGSQSRRRPAGWPRWWRWTIVVLSTLILSACKPGLHPPATGLAEPVPSMLPAAAAIPAGGAMMGGDAQGLQPLGLAGQLASPGFDRGVPLPEVVTGPWSPPGIAVPWPTDEYLRDGGDRGLLARVEPDWRINGLEPEDTIVHYDTLDGRTVVEPSNRVHVYAPRFGAVRAVTGLIEEAQIEVTRGVDLPANLARYEFNQTAESRLQLEQALRHVGSNRLNTFRMRMGDGVLSLALKPQDFREHFAPYEDVAVIRNGIFQGADKPRLSQSIEAAVVWTHNQAVQVLLNEQQAAAAVGDQRAEAVFVVQPQGVDRLRVIKVASTNYARPGETVDFTIRFDNVGDQPIGNVTIVDNLTNRLEYVPDSAQSSRRGNFLTEYNEAGSLALRWEIEDPLPAGEGGIVRFRCVVR